MSNFSWVIERRLAGSSLPKTDEDFSFLKGAGIHAIINLTEDEYDLKSRSLKDFTLYHIPIPDFGVPKEEQIYLIWEIFKKHVKVDEAVLIHCFAGCGRTGLVLASLLILSEFAKTPAHAISKMRIIRPCSIETSEQEKYLKKITKFMDRIR